MHIIFEDFKFFLLHFLVRENFLVKVFLYIMLVLFPLSRHACLLASFLPLASIASFFLLFQFYDRSPSCYLIFHAGRQSLSSSFSSHLLPSTSSIFSPHSLPCANLKSFLHIFGCVLPLILMM